MMPHNHGRIRLTEEMAQVLDEQLKEDVGDLFAKGRDDLDARHRLRVLLKLRRYLRSLREEMGWDEWDSQATWSHRGVQARETDTEEAGLR